MQWDILFARGSGMAFNAFECYTRLTPLLNIFSLTQMNPVVDVEALFEEGFIRTLVALVTFTGLALVDAPVTPQTSHIYEPLTANLAREVPAMWKEVRGHDITSKGYMSTRHYKCSRLFIKGVN